MGNNMRKFEVVVDKFRKHKGVNIQLPKRATKGSMAYDFYAPIGYEAKPGEIIKIWTDVKAAMNIGEALLINVRSSMGGNWQLANTQGWIDSDYYSNESNDGNIGVFLKNISNITLVIGAGEKIAQGIFISYLTTDDDDVNTERTGGFGSTGK